MSHECVLGTAIKRYIKVMLK